MSIGHEAQATRLHESMQPFYKELSDVLEGIEQLPAVMNSQDIVVADTSGRWLRISFSASENAAYLYRTTSPKDPGYYFENNTDEHFVVCYSKEGANWKIQFIREYSPTEMKKNGVSGYHTRYTVQDIQSADLTAKLIGSFDTLRRLQKYITAAGL